MNLLINILVYVIETLGGLYLGVVLLRFFLQLARADFYNPLSQGIVRLTNPLLIPLRRVIPGVFGIDIASLLLALALQVIIGELVFFVVTQTFFNPLSVLIYGMLGLLMMTYYLFWVVIIVVVVSSFVAPYSSHPAIMLARQLLEPLMQPIQRLIPPMGGLDFSVLFIGMGNYILGMIVEATANGMGITYPPLNFLVIGF